MSDATNEIPWGDLGESWWRETGEQVKASEQQTKLAACLFAGMTQTAAARLSGYSSEDERARKSGSEAARTTRVKTLLALATAEVRARNLPSAPKTLMTRDEALEKLTDIARGTDKSLALRALEAINKADREGEGDVSFFTMMDTDGLNDWRIVRDNLLMPNGAIAIAALYDGQGVALADMPLLLDVVARLKRDHEPFFEHLRRNQGTTAMALLDARLMDAGWQRETRQKIWREKGMTIEDAESEAARPIYATSGLMRAGNGVDFRQQTGA